MAAAILAHLAREKGLRFEIKSAGTSASHGDPISLLAGRILTRRGIDPGSHVATPLTEELIAWADLVLTMTADHKCAAVAISPANSGRIFTIAEYVDADGEVSDPLPEMSEEAYERCADHLESLISQVVARTERD